MLILYNYTQCSTHEWYDYEQKYYSTVQRDSIDVVILNLFTRVPFCTVGLQIMIVLYNYFDLCACTFLYSRPTDNDCVV